MNNIFKKSDRPFIKKFAQKTSTPRDYWTMARKIITEDGYTCNNSTVILLLQQGAANGDVWSMCQLARTYYKQNDDLLLPLALHWWYHAAKEQDSGTLRDLDSHPILSRINSYSGGSSEYGTIEMRCTMLTAWILTRLGRDNWGTLSFSEQEHRVEQLIISASTHLHIKPPVLNIIPGLTGHNGQIVDGTAGTNWILKIRKECFDNLDRLIQVIFHELGHLVTFSMWDKRNQSQMDRFGITHKRIDTWHNKTMGLEVTTMEEDPDTLSYGVYTNWVFYFH